MPPWCTLSLFLIVQSVFSSILCGLELSDWNTNWVVRFSQVVLNSLVDDVTAFDMRKFSSLMKSFSALDLIVYESFNRTSEAFVFNRLRDDIVDNPWDIARLWSPLEITVKDNLFSEQIHACGTFEAPKSWVLFLQDPSYDGFYQDLTGRTLIILAFGRQRCWSHVWVLSTGS